MNTHTQKEQHRHRNTETHRNVCPTYRFRHGVTGLQRVYRSRQTGAHTETHSHKSFTHRQAHRDSHPGRHTEGHTQPY
jgi:hypothetical protein